MQAARSFASNWSAISRRSSAISGCGRHRAKLARRTTGKSRFLVRSHGSNIIVVTQSTPITTRSAGVPTDKCKLYLAATGCRSQSTFIANGETPPACVIGTVKGCSHLPSGALVAVRAFTLAVPEPIDLSGAVPFWPAGRLRERDCDQQ